MAKPVIRPRAALLASVSSPRRRRRVGTGASGRPGRRSDREQGPAHRSPDARPGDAQPREWQERHHVLRGHQRVHRRRQGEGGVPPLSSRGTAWPRSPARTSARASRLRSRAASRRGRGTTTVASGTGRRRSSPTTSRCCRGAARRTTRPSTRPTRSRRRPSGRDGEAADPIAAAPAGRRRRGRRGRGGRDGRRPDRRTSRGGGAAPSGRRRPYRRLERPTELEERDGQDQVDDHEQAPSSQFDSPSRAMSALIPTAAATAATSSGSNTRSIGWPRRTPSSTRTGATNSATWRLEP